MSDLDINSLDWQKMNGLLPAIIQNAENGKVLMLGYMNQEALIATLTTGQLTLYSRSRKRLWRKGESSGNSMALQHISADCDNDSLLIQVIPKGPACHLGYSTCYQPHNNYTLGFLDGLIELINERAEEENPNSYTAQLLDSGMNRCAQKLGEEAVETVIAAVSNNKEELINEASDLIYHLLVLLKACELSFYDVLLCLQARDRSVHT
ncbi:TPA: bifunctional phosphoribosyl-AMP cyclohydrolase/phosphoribosyl-ATP diphosphatase HisIE [Legionella pneumophila subsp. pneumophila]|uniref:bifunctional phosphoribosyl-AMP cyclohydrolase/phosphoribosyl-ATP diphosphatase HisIE n=1 Tax=Legionella pneumophila TaxID=446 RepID=UPI0007708A05|nr:bifunctional phosphoribosyl-AMP cyclohydrolase/phosphoribosyl-ATP diphosphatase HisIE [Legionella pneumophila]HAT9245912.1 bifunctional phosphoribosyl-AMP cyclohydrolase/phosphoribosyl-ATP diphosphatase HisIE [Legionella pneumophila subsp. pneumophila]CZI68157.1 Phosphoribosyl-ATP pyrophosphatase [Legionella pneumophila]CZI79997.1 Phosphoribosyl-ATP pyrophosphatase [Legionella pneumophila]CZI95204.1 Phosphoribosyl-ATP pyrophosphatase [Legionella pneumophila]CZR08117.1 Phosphoribosyl-ATP pyr